MSPTRRRRGTTAGSRCPYCSYTAPMIILARPSTRRLAEPMRESCADLTEVVVQSGHWMAQENPVAVNAALARFLATKLPSVWRGLRTAFNPGREIKSCSLERQVYGSVSGAGPISPGAKPLSRRPRAEARTGIRKPQTDIHRDQDLLRFTKAGQLRQVARRNAR